MIVVCANREVGSGRKKDAYSSVSSIGEIDGKNTDVISGAYALRRMLKN